MFQLIDYSSFDNLLHKLMPENQFLSIFRFSTQFRLRFWLLLFTAFSRRQLLGLDHVFGDHELFVIIEIVQPTGVIHVVHHLA